MPPANSSPAEKAKRRENSPAQKDVNTRIIGYHECDMKTAGGVVARKEVLQQGKERCDWLGTGVYGVQKRGQTIERFISCFFRLV